jgi:EXS family
MSLADYHPLDNPHPPHLNRRDIYKPVYSIAIILATVTLISLATFWVFTSGDASAVVSYELLPLSCFASVFILALCPLNILYHDERFRFLRVLRRIMVGGLDVEGKFGDIVLADILTSYAKVLEDLWVTGCMFLGGVSAAGKPDRACGGKFAVPLVIRYFSFHWFFSS